MKGAYLPENSETGGRSRPTSKSRCDTGHCSIGVEETGDRPATLTAPVCLRASRPLYRAPQSINNGSISHGAGDGKSKVKVLADVVSAFWVTTAGTLGAEDILLTRALIPSRGPHPHNPINSPKTPPPPTTPSPWGRGFQWKYLEENKYSDHSTDGPQLQHTDEHPGGFCKCTFLCVVTGAPML